MKKTSALLALLLVGAAPTEARTMQPPSYTVEILIDGETQPQIVDPSRGKTYVEAFAGKEYSIRIKNPTGQRVAAAVAVDGLNSFDAKHTSAKNAVKWVIQPYGSVTVSGWQVSKDRLRRFVFTTEEASYGKSIGKTADLGTISVAVFREKVALNLAAEPSSDVRARRAPASLGGAGAGSGIELKSGAGVSGKASMAPALAATAQGRSEAHAVRMVDLQLQATPAATFAIRYEFRDALVRLGVLPQKTVVDRALDRRERAEGFEKVDFAPEQK